MQCPGAHQTSPPGSNSVEEVVLSINIRKDNVRFLFKCKCKEGYELKSGKCRVMDCPHLLPPENGYFIRNECNNVFNAACGIRCNSGYQVSCIFSGSKF